MQAGLNLYSIRNYLDTEEHFLEAALALKEMGYSYIQYSGGAFDADRIARVSAQSGLPVVLTHVPMDRIVNDTQALMEEHAKFGCKNIGLGAMPPDAIADESRCKQMIEQLNKAGEVMQQNGFSFFYHHHHFERKIDLMNLKDKTNRITLRLNDKQFEFVKENAEILDTSPSEFLRMVINSAMVMNQKLGEVKGRENDKTNLDNLV